MAVETDVHRALERVRAERDRTTEKRRQFDRFESAVAGLETRTSSANARGTAHGGASGGSGATALPRASTGTSAGTKPGTKPGPSTGTVLEAFEEHLAAHSGDALTQPESVPEAVAEEFSTDLATALCGGASAGVLTPSLKAAVLEEARSRTAELDVTNAALEAEAESLRATLEPIDAVVDWFVANNPTPLSDLGFDRLRDWHRCIEEHRTSLERAAHGRQRHLQNSTTRSGAVGIEHDALLEYLYAPFEDAHPALATVARTEETCRSAQRSLREHLTRRP